MSNYTPAVECGLSKQDIHKLAAEVAEMLEFGPGDDLEAAASKLGGRINRVGANEFDDTIDGSIRVHGFGDFDIFVPDDAGPLRERFTIAHEFGHYILHFDPESGPMQAERFGAGRVEWEANWFAAGFLMPDQKFREAHEKHAGYLADIAAEFSVSLQAARIQANYLKLKYY